MMSEQNRCRSSLAPLQPVLFDSITTDREKSTKRLRGTSRSYLKMTDEMSFLAEGQENSAIVSTFRAPQPDPFTFNCRQDGSPLPSVKWANQEEVWKLMCWKERTYAKDSNLFQRHVQITPKMRAVLFEWLSEVCEVYKLHRETFYLCMDFVDRYLSIENQVPKCRLQLIGITSLFIAAKLEEIYPPQLKDFAYVTDGACTAGDILELELVMLKTLNWALCPITTVHWLMLYLQVVANRINSQVVKTSVFPVRCRDFILPQFQRLDFIRLTQLTDLCSLNPGVLCYSNSVVAASALFHILQPVQWSFLSSGYVWSDLESCVNWMAPFAQVVKEENVQVKLFPEITHDDMHNIQAHFVGMPLMDKAHRLASAMALDIFPTPPSSDERYQPHVSRVPSPSSWNFTGRELAFNESG